MKQTIRRYGTRGFYGVNQDDRSAATITYHGTDNHGVCAECGNTFTRGWLVLSPTCECGYRHAEHDRAYCSECVTIAPPVPARN